MGDAYTLFFWYDSFVYTCNVIKLWKKGQKPVQILEKFPVKGDLIPMCILP